MKKGEVDEDSYLWFNKPFVYAPLHSKFWRGRMYAIVETGGKQYKVQKNDIILVERLDGKEDKIIKLNKVLLAKEGNAIHIGSPYLKDWAISCEILGPRRAEKVIAYKYKRRKSYKKKIGHRQDLTMLKVKEIEMGKE